MRGVMRVAAVHLYALPLECVFDDECIAQRPCAVRAEVKGRLFVIGLSDSARLAGLHPNMTQSEAKARLAKLNVRSRNAALEVERLHAAAELLMAFGPHVEVGPPNMLWVEIGRGRRELDHRLGAAGRAGGEASVAEAIVETFKKVGHRVTVAIGPDPDTARTFAQHLAQQRWAAPEARSTPLRRRQRARGAAAPPKRRKPPRGSDFVVVADHQTAGQLGRLPLEALAWTDKHIDPEAKMRDRLHEIIGSLKLLGVRDVARLASLPAAQVCSRFGEAGALLVRRAVGADVRPLRPFLPPDRLTESYALDSVTEDLEPILFVLRRVFSRLEARLEARRLATTEIRIHFTIEPGLTEAIDPNAPQPKSSRRQVTLPIRLARPTRKTKTLLSVAKEKLDGQLPGAVWSVEAEVDAPSRDPGAQLDLFNAHARRVEDVGALISRLQAALGPEAVFTPRHEDTHRPEAAWSLAPFDIERALAEPAPPPPPKATAIDGPAPALEPANRILYALPTVDDALSVTGQVTGPAGRDAPSTALDALVSDETRSWPKPVPRHLDDEPLPPLPPRPMALFGHPEPATMLKPSGLDEGVLVWRGRRHHLVTMTGNEQLAAEWWTARPLDRAYVVAEAADGRRFWLFVDRQGDVFVHGVFD